MAAYMIVYAAIKDRDKFIQGYAPAAAKLVAEHGGKYLIRAQGGEVLEGDDGVIDKQEGCWWLVDPLHASTHRKLVLNSRYPSPPAASFQNTAHSAFLY